MSLAETISEYIKAETELSQQKACCDGTWGDYLYDEIERVRDLEERIKDEITEIIKTEIAKATKKGE